MTFLGLAWQAWAFLALAFCVGRWWWRAVRAEWLAARQPAPVVDAPVEAPDVPAAPASCLHVRVAPVVSTAGTVVADLCLDCDEQLDVRTPAWP